MRSAARNRRINVRVTESQDAVIREAAALAGETVTGFLLSAAEARAGELLERRRHLVMSATAFAALDAALDAPPVVAEELKELFGLERIPHE